MSKYAYIQNGVVQEIIQPFYKEGGILVPIEERFTPQFLADTVDISNEDPLPGPWWTYVDGSFEPPNDI